MTFIIDSVIHVSMILLIGLSSLVVLRKSSAAIRHWVLSAAILCAAIVPALRLVMPSWSLTSIVQQPRIDLAVRPAVASIDPTPPTGKPIPAGPAAVGARAESKMRRWIPEHTNVYRWLPGVIWSAGFSMGLLV